MLIFHIYLYINYTAAFASRFWSFILLTACFKAPCISLSDYEKQEAM